MDPAADSTVSLIVAARDGRREALGTLLDRYQGYLLMLAHRYLSDQLRRRVDPSDIVQITCLEIQRDLPKFRGETTAEFVAWMRGMLKNNVASAVTRHITTQKRSLRREARPASPTASSAGDWIAGLPGGKTTPSGVAVRGEAVAKLLEALHELPETQAEAIRLRYMEGLPLAEIVDRMGKSDTAVAGLLKRGLKKLRGILSDDDNPYC